ncbi:cytochrome b561 domain-containing protein [Lichenihabitans psoromatis]|uniref:cytochrome b561 domain-containing protein n=1 Tax=Lichenihabitans psoromatis TaxID=2528642 RepID=UPI001035990B|nr:cytochrome b561 domain-containing protein [Lichenihabitans psoromatis]
MKQPTRSQLSSSQKTVSPCLVLVAINIVATLSAAVIMWRADVLPPIMAVHAALMIVSWGCLLPLGGLVARYFKVMPAQPFPDVVDHPFWWNCHRALQYVGATLATVAVLVILRDVGGHVGTVHGVCGLVVMVFAWLQVLSPLLRGTKGGPTDSGAEAAIASTWRGDHYDMSLRRRLFETWHKTIGWGLLVLAQITIILGADLAGSPDWLCILLAVSMMAIVLAILDSHIRGRWVDTHAALWGPAAWPRTRDDARSMSDR